MTQQSPGCKPCVLLREAALSSNKVLPNFPDGHVLKSLPINMHSMVQRKVSHIAQKVVGQQAGAFDDGSDVAVRKTYVWCIPFVGVVGAHDMGIPNASIMVSNSKLRPKCTPVA